MEYSGYYLNEQKEPEGLPHCFCHGGRIDAV